MTKEERSEAIEAAKEILAEMQYRWDMQDVYYPLRRKKYKKALRALDAIIAKGKYDAKPLYELKYSILLKKRYISKARQAKILAESL